MMAISTILLSCPHPHQITKTRTIIRASTIILLGLGAAFALMLVFQRAETREPVPQLVGKNVVVTILKKQGINLSYYDLDGAKLLHIHRTGKVYNVDQGTLVDTSLYQDSLPRFPHDMYVWLIPLAREKAASTDRPGMVVDASSGQGLGDIFPRADCPLAPGAEVHRWGFVDYLVYYAKLDNGRASYTDPSLKGTFSGNPEEYKMINMTNSFPDVLLMLGRYNNVCVAAFPTHTYSKVDHYFPNSKNQVSYVAMEEGSDKQITLVEKFDSANRFLGRLLYCGTDARPVLNPGLEVISACFNSTGSNNS